MHDKRPALADLLLDESEPRGSRCGVKRVASLSFLIGLGFAVLLHMLPSIRGEAAEESAIAMAWQSAQAVRAMPFTHMMRKNPLFMQPRPQHILPVTIQYHTPRRVAMNAEGASGFTDSNNFKNGMNIEIKGVPHKILKFLHVKPGKGSAFVRTTVKDLLNGGTVEITFKGGEKVDLAPINTWTGTYTYDDADACVFMNIETYDEVRIPKSDDFTRFLKEGMDVIVKEWNGKAIDIQLPSPYAFEITMCDPASTSDGKSGGGNKPATIETGAEIKVPLFCKVGDKVSIDTSTGEYKSRA